MPYIPVVTDRTSREEDEQQYRLDHFKLFGHYPIPNLSTGQRCGHPDHDAHRRIMESSGAHVVIPFDAGEVTSDDEADAVQFQIKYNARVEEMRDRIRALEEYEKWLEQRNLRGIQQ